MSHAMVRTANAGLMPLVLEAELLQRGVGGAALDKAHHTLGGDVVCFQVQNFNRGVGRQNATHFRRKAVAEAEV